MELINILVVAAIIGIILGVIGGAVTKFKSTEHTARRYRKAVEICGEGNVIQNGRFFDCEDFLKIDTK